MKDNETYMLELVDKCDYDTKLAVTAWAMKHIVDHARDGGTYRYLIYDRLGFEPDAYAPLCSDGLTISNEFELDVDEKIQKLYNIVLNDKEGDLDFIKSQFEKLKNDYNICDEPGCTETVSCGWPSENGYRRTCGEHMKKDVE
jgi:hypothetical protein